MSGAFNSLLKSIPFQRTLLPSASRSPSSTQDKHQPPMKYITPEELADVIKSEKAPLKDYVVVDVRGDDFVGGNIKGCLNRPSGEFLMNVDSLVRDTRNVPLMIFHCALSQARGPKAARIYEETRRNIIVDDGDIQQEVMVLRDGFAQFQVKYKDDPELVENWDKDVWASEWS